MIGEEALPLSFPAITPRDTIGWPEAIDGGCLIMTGVDKGTMLGGIEAITQAFAECEAAGLPHPSPQDYCITNTSERVVKIIFGTAQLSSLWDGIRKNQEAVGR